MAWNVRLWGHMDDVPLEGQIGGEGCRVIVSVPGPLQSVQRAELWGVILALQACTSVFVGVDNKNVVNHVGNLISGKWKGRPFPLVKMVIFCVSLTICFGHEIMIRFASVRLRVMLPKKWLLEKKVRREDMIGNNLADEAADLGRRRQTERV